MSIFKVTSGQCDQMARYLFNIWPDTTMKIFPRHKIFSKLGSIFYQILNKPTKTAKVFKILTKWLDFNKFGHTGQHANYATTTATKAKQF